MTTLQLCDRYRLCMDVDLDGCAGKDATDAEVVVFLNEALDEYGKMVPAKDYRMTVLLAQGNYLFDATTAIGDTVLMVEKIFIDGQKLAYMGPTSFSSCYERFAYADQADPCAWTREKPTKVLLSCPISAASAAKTWTAECQVAPARLSSGTPTIEPEIPRDLHPFLVWIAIAKSAQPWQFNVDQVTVARGLEDRAMKEFSAYGGKVTGEQVDAVNPTEYRRPRINLR